MNILGNGWLKKIWGGARPLEYKPILVSWPVGITRGEFQPEPLIKINTMHFKKKILIAVYSMYIEGIEVEFIGHHLKLCKDEVNEIIDFINYIIL